MSGGHSHPPQRFALCLAGSGWGGQGACTGIDDDRLGLDHQVDGLLGNLGDGLGRLRRLVLVNRRLDRARLVVLAAEVLLGVLGGELAGGDGHAEAFKLAVGVCSVWITAMHRTISISVRLVVLSSVWYVVDRIYTQSERAWPLPRLRTFPDLGRVLLAVLFHQVLGRSL